MYFTTLDRALRSRPTLIKAVIYSVASLMPLVIWLQTHSDLLYYFQHETPPGQATYIFSKLLGFYVISLLWLQLLIAKLPKSNSHKKKVKPPTNEHVYIGFAVFLTIFSHILCFIFAVFLRSGKAPIQLFVPNLNQDYYHNSISIGAIGLWLIVIVMLAGLARRHKIIIGSVMHKLAFPAFFLGLIHSFLIGTETRSFVYFAFVSFMIFTLLILYLYSVSKPYRTIITS
ncbi:hypothetical protein [Gilvimarinus algae]|uniref:Ferric oxidoreductase domain-containing protein n=1 Tax=Gilvimarinus algae TaxID=3058037 RepID=A0ABT8TE38_9GAMM|nr:hypothetical protein [Gilvimarinus sp. SDUM040014]MDO3382369.1 hypothetical protein [Gilvimarinus sp. SDUM040014]